MSHRPDFYDNDLIDFPCADGWLDHYHEQGLTPRRSPGYLAREMKPALQQLAHDIMDEVRSQIADQVEQPRWAQPKQPERPPLTYPSEHRPVQRRVYVDET
jgi:hypothetical protein